MADLKALLATDPKLAAVIDKETWTALTAHTRVLAALGVTEEQYTQAKPTAADMKPSEDVIDAG